MGLGGPMTPAGVIELPLLAIQILGSIAAAWVGMRVVDDIRHLRTIRAERANRS